MRKITISICAFFVTITVSSQSLEEILKAGDSEFQKTNDTIFKQDRSGGDDPYNILLYNREDHENFMDAFFAEYRNSRYFDKINNVVLDDFEDDTQPVVRTKTELIPIPIKLSTGQEVVITFGRSSDGVSGYQEVDTLLVNTLKDVLEISNKELLKRNVPPIKTLFVLCTTNGHKPWPNSNHNSGTAIDISEINGNRIIYTRISGRISKQFKEDIEKLDYDKDIKGKYRLVFQDAVAVQIDELYLYERVKMLQAVFLKHKRSRENFGPFLMKKKLMSQQIIDKKESVRPHEDHLHFSVR